MHGQRRRALVRDDRGRGRDGQARGVRRGRRVAVRVQVVVVGVVARVVAVVPPDDHVAGDRWVVLARLDAADRDLFSLGPVMDADPEPGVGAGVVGIGDLGAAHRDGAELGVGLERGVDRGRVDVVAQREAVELQRGLSRALGVLEPAADDLAVTGDEGRAVDVLERDLVLVGVEVVRPKVAAALPTDDVAVRVVVDVRRAVAAAAAETNFVARADAVVVDVPVAVAEVLPDDQVVVDPGPLLGGGIRADGDLLAGDDVRRVDVPVAVAVVVVDDPVTPQVRVALLVLVIRDLGLFAGGVVVHPDIAGPARGVRAIVHPDDPVAMGRRLHLFAVGRAQRVVRDDHARGARRGERQRRQHKRQREQHRQHEPHREPHPCHDQPFTLSVAHLPSPISVAVPIDRCIDGSPGFLDGESMHRRLTSTWGARLPVAQVASSRGPGAVDASLVRRCRSIRSSAIPAP